MSYILYSDKTEIFEAKIKISGASLKKSFCRLVIESEDWNLVFNGEIDDAGNCSIPIKKLKGVIPEGVHGKMKLEVVAEDTYFVPWESEFNVEVAKTVKVEVKQQKSKKVVQEKRATAEVMSKPKPKPKLRQKQKTIIVAKGGFPQIPVKLTEVNHKVHLKEFTKKLISEGITYDNINVNQDRINELVHVMSNKHNISEDTMKWIISNTFKLLEKRKNK